MYHPPFMSLPEFTEAAQLASLAFLGPPSSAYHTDPDKFVFVRVAGGFSPKYVGQVRGGTVWGKGLAGAKWSCGGRSGDQVT